MEAHDSPVPLLEALLFLAVAGLLVPLLQRLRVNPVFGFLAAGALLGPHGIGGLGERLPWLARAGFADREAVQVPAQLGLLFLMFSIGLELSLERLRALRRWVFGAGIAQMVATSAAIGTAAWGLLGLPPAAAAVVGVVLAFSSTAVALQLLAERDRLGTPLGRASFAVLLMQDLAVVPLLLAVTVLGASGAAGPGAAGAAGAAEAAADGAGLLLDLGWALGKGAAAMLLLFVVGRRVLQPAFRRLIVPGRPDTFVALTLLASLGIAAATGAVGMSPALGALLAGLLLAETEFRHEIEATLEPFKSLLMGLFFMSVGMGLELGALAREPLTVLGAVLALFLIKAALLAPILRIAGLPTPQAVEAGLLLGQGGEFGFVMLGVALASGVLAPDVERTVGLVIGVSLFATPLAASLGRRLSARLERRAVQAAVATAAAGAAASSAADPQAQARRPPELVGPPSQAALPEGLAEPVAGAPVSGRIVLAGHGRIGRQIGEMLERDGVDWLAIETDPRAIVDDHEAGRPVVYGDVTRPELLRRLGVGEAVALVVTLPRLSAAIAAVEVARREAPGLRIVARARDEREARRLREAGADEAVAESLECGLRLAAGALGALGLSDEEVARRVGRERDRRTAP
jgi:monovalent cation:H+ antiporter-2, CPA2 family